MASPELETAAPSATAPPEVVLTPKISPRWALSLPHVGVCLLFVGLFLTANHLPLFFSDLWGHVSYGHWILEHRELPVEDPFVPLAEGVTFHDSAWLSQVIFALVEKRGGAEALSGLYAAVVLATYLVFWRMSYVLTSRLWLSVAGMALVMVLASSRVLVIRPEIFAVFCCAVLLWTLAGRRRSAVDPPVETTRLWFAASLCVVPVMMAAWANLHGSFVVGIAILGCHLLGRMVDVFLATRSLSAVFYDRWTRRWLVLTELGAAATLLNPYGIDLWLSTLTFGKNPNLQTVLEWQPLSMQVPEAFRYIFAAVLGIVVVRHSPRRMRSAEVLLLAVFAAAVVFASRMMTWYAAVFVAVLLPHAAAALATRWPAFVKPLPPVRELGGGLVGPSFRHTAACVAIVWVGFALSSFATPLLGGLPKTPAQLYHPDTPLGISEYLREHPPEGQVWNPQWWGDWLVWAGPKRWQPFMTTMSVHAAPPQVWTDYERIAQAEPGWPNLLDKYDVQTVVVDKTQQPRLNELIRSGPNWKVVYEDEQGAVLELQPVPAEKSVADDETAATPAGA
ncbi:MAG: hypothetical protein WED34_10685 [Planctomycetales bacterium]